MNSKNHDLTEFEDLIAELENPEVRPYAPNLPRQTKEKMRRTLFTTQDGGLSRQAAMNLWKFAGTAVAGFLLLFIAASFIAIISNPSTQAGVVSPPTRTSNMLTPEANKDLINRFEFLLERLRGLQVTPEVHEESVNQPAAPPTMEAGSDASVIIQFEDWRPAELQDRIWLVSASPAPGTNLYDTDGVPTTFTFEIGYELVSAESALLNWGLEPVGEGELPRYVYYAEPQQEITRGTGTVTAEVTMSSNRLGKLAEAVAPQIWLSLPGRRIALPLETMTDLVWPLTPEESGGVWQEWGDVWLVSVKQQERPSADAPINLEVTLGYEFVSEEDVFIKLSYANLNYESVVYGERLPVDGLGNPIFLDNNQGEVTINATLSPNEAMQIVGSEEPVLWVDLGYIQEFEDERDNVIRFLAQEIFGGYPLDLTTTEEIQHSPP